jgi:sulfoacetaldehyde dehydrogenase
LPEDLVQILPPASGHDAGARASRRSGGRHGSQDNAACLSSGTPAIGVGTGNVPVIADDCRSRRCRQEICASKIFDNSTSCSSENSVILGDAIHDKAIAALQRAGGYMASSAGPKPGGAVARRQLSRMLIGAMPMWPARGCGVPAAAEGEVLHGGETGVGRLPFW